MNYPPEEKFDLVHGLNKLFAEIDINGDSKMEWREFTQYVIDAVMQDHVKAASVAKAPNQKELLDAAHSRKFMRFSESSLSDNCVHEGSIQKALYYPSLNRVLLIESRSHLLKFVTPELKKKEIIDLYSKDIDLYTKDERGTERTFGQKEEKYFVLTAAYDEKDKIVTLTEAHSSIARLCVRQQNHPALRDLWRRLQTRQNRQDHRRPIRHLVHGAPQRLGHGQSASRAQVQYAVEGSRCQ
jgi:hypothetical protein